MSKKEWLLGLVLLVVCLTILFLFPRIKVGSLQERRKAEAKLTDLNDKSSAPCKIKSFYEAYDDWVILCNKYPFENGQAVGKEVVKALENIGLLCPRYSWPSSKSVNKLCEFYCS
jgi:hypothetical protein